MADTVTTKPPFDIVGDLIYDSKLFYTVETLVARTWLSEYQVRTALKTLHEQGEVLIGRLAGVGAGRPTQVFFSEGAF